MKILFPNCQATTEHPLMNNLLFRLTVSDEETDRLIEANPKSLKHVDERERNILFYEEVPEKYKDLLLEKFPESLKHVDEWARNILFHEKVPEKYKDLLVEKFPESLKQLDVWGTNILFYEEVPEKYKDLLVEKFPESLNQVDKDGKNIFFYEKVQEKYKDLYKKLHEKPIPTRIIDREDNSICFVCLIDYEIGDEVTINKCGHDLHIPCFVKYNKEHGNEKCYCGCNY